MGVDIRSPGEVERRPWSVVTFEPSGPATVI